MITVKDILLATDFESVAKEIKLHYDSEKHMQTVERVYRKLKEIPCKANKDEVLLFIRVLKENEEGIDVVIQDFDTNDNTLMFDVCGVDDHYEGLYSMASAEYDELVSCFVDQTTIERFSYSQIIAHILWELEWK